MDITKLTDDEKNLIRKISNRIVEYDSSRNIKLKSRKGSKPGQYGKYKYIAENLNNMNLTYEDLLKNASLCPRRLNKIYSLSELKQRNQIGIFARRTLSDEIIK